MKSQNNHGQDISIDRLIWMLPGHVYWINTDNIYQGCNNEQAESFCLTDHDDVIGKTNKDFFDQKTAEMLNQKNKVVMLQGKSIVTEESVVWPSGKSGTYLSNKIPLFNKDHKVVGLLGVSFDITERKEMEEHLRTAKENAEAANISKYNFLHDMEYDIRTAFVGVYGLAKELNYKCEMPSQEEQDRKLTDPEIKGLVNMMYLSSEQLLNICTGMIDATRHESGMHPVLDAKFNLKKLLNDMIAMEKPAATQKKLDLLFNYPADMPNVFIGDHYRIQCILINLLGNAIKFTDKGHVMLSVEVKQKNDRDWIVQLAVEDTGIGIAPENHDVIYEKFSRLNRAHEKKYGGLGLGLHAVKHLLKEIDGEIDLKSTPEKGSTFTITLLLKRPLLGDEAI